MYTEVDDRISRGLQYADDTAVTPYVIVVSSKVDHVRAGITLRNFSATPGIITDVRLFTGPHIYRWQGKCVIEGNGTISDFTLRFWDEGLDPPLDRHRFEIEVCDLAEVVTRRRSGIADQIFDSPPEDD